MKGSRNIVTSHAGKQGECSKHIVAQMWQHSYIATAEGKRRSRSLPQDRSLTRLHDNLVMRQRCRLQSNRDSCRYVCGELDRAELLHHEARVTRLESLNTGWQPVDDERAVRIADRLPIGWKKANDGSLDGCQPTTRAYGPLETRDGRLRRGIDPDDDEDSAEALDGTQIMRPEDLV